MKMIIALFIRLKEGKSMFSNPDLDILWYFQRTYFKEYPEILKLYNRILGGIENIDNWYGFLKEGKLKGGDLEWDLEETFEHLYAEFRIVKSFITKNLPQSTTSSPASQLLTN
jgi:hypothetical protein